MVDTGKVVDAREHQYRSYTVRQMPPGPMMEKRSLTGRRAAGLSPSTMFRLKYSRFRSKSHASLQSSLCEGVHTYISSLPVAKTCEWPCGA